MALSTDSWVTLWPAAISACGSLASAACRSAFFCIERASSSPANCNLRSLVVFSIAALMTSSAILAFALYRSNACSGVNTFAIFARSLKSGALGIAKAAAFGATFGAAFGLGFLAPARERAVVFFADDLVAMISQTPLMGDPERCRKLAVKRALYCYSTLTLRLRQYCTHRYASDPHMLCYLCPLDVIAPTQF